MGILRLLVDLVGAVAWPLGAVILAIVFRRPITDLLDRVRSVKADTPVGSIEAKTGDAVAAQSQREVEGLLGARNNDDDDSPGKPYGPTRFTVNQMVGALSAFDAMQRPASDGESNLIAWRTVDHSVSRLVGGLSSIFGIPTPPRGVSPGAYLASAGLPPRLASAVDELWNTKERVTDPIDPLSLSQDSANSIASTASWILKQADEWLLVQGYERPEPLDG